jgi:hypothetical protein
MHFRYCETWAIGRGPVSDRLCLAEGPGLGFFEWVWETASDKVLGPGFVGSAWLGIVRRRRWVTYDRHLNGLLQGGMRGWTRFEW